MKSVLSLALIFALTVCSISMTGCSEPATPPVNKEMKDKAEGMEKDATDMKEKASDMKDDAKDMKEKAGHGSDAK